jgi:MEDS: MEthanogen/methylotroph, DcmR Sensory domain
MSRGERILRGNVVSEHFVQLFDEPDSLVSAVTAFLLDGWNRGDNLLVAARATNWALTSTALEANDVPVSEAIASGRLVVLDAATAMATFMVNGDPQPDKFQTGIGDLVERLAASSRAGLSIYGEMVDLLAAQGNFVAAEQLEAAWNALSQRVSFRLLCGYSSAHFGDECTTKHLHAICAAHDDAGAHPTDLLAVWLLANRRPKYHLDSH